MKAKLVDGGKKIWIDCPGCDGPHVLRLASAFPESPRWTWNGSLEAPTLDPSIMSSWEHPTDGRQVCHSFVRGGRIEFLGDCTHAMAGKTVDLPEAEVQG